MSFLSNLFGKLKSYGLSAKNTLSNLGQKISGGFSSLKKRFGFGLSHPDQSSKPQYKQTPFSNEFPDIGGYTEEMKELEDIRPKHKVKSLPPEYLEEEYNTPLGNLPVKNKQMKTHMPFHIYEKALGYGKATEKYRPETQKAFQLYNKTF